MNSRKIVVFTGSGISAPSGLATFRDPDGIWARYKIEEVATPEAWRRDPSKVLSFYNERRRQLQDVHPNPAHHAIADLEKRHSVVVLTQNVDDLHERSGSSHVVHLHGELRKVRSSGNSSLIYDVGYTEVNPGDTCAEGFQLRPHVVWFGEPVFSMEEAIHHASACDIFIIAGTSLNVYPAAGLADLAPASAQKYIIDLETSNAATDFTFIRESADTALPRLAALLVR